MLKLTCRIGPLLPRPSLFGVSATPHPSSDGVVAVLAAPQQGTVLPEVAVLQRQDVLVPLYRPLEDVLEIGVVRPRGLVAVVDEDVLA